MERRPFGRLGTVSALTLGGGGIGGVWGPTDRAEAVATVHAALDAGVTMLDVAPTYGDGEAESVVGQALAGRDTAGVLVSTKVELVDTDPGDLVERVHGVLRGSLDRLGRDAVDLLYVHTGLRPDDSGSAAPRSLGLAAFRSQVRPALLRLRDDGVIGGWGLSAVGHPRALEAALADDDKPDAVQVVVNALDLTGDMWVWGGDGGRPRNTEIRTWAVEAGVPVVAIRVVAAGALTDALDRDVAPTAPAAVDLARAAGFRRLAAAHGTSPAALAHRWALATPGVATVVLGVKNRVELAECLAAAAAPLSERDRQDIAAGAWV